MWKNASVWADTHLTGVSTDITFRRPVGLTHRNGQLQDMSAKWKEHERHMKGIECNMKGTWKEINGNNIILSTFDKKRLHTHIKQLENSHLIISFTESPPPAKTRGVKNTLTTSKITWCRFLLMISYYINIIKIIHMINHVPQHIDYLASSIIPLNPIKSHKIPYNPISNDLFLPIPRSFRLRLGVA